jgi:hypothetical protein
MNEFPWFDLAGSRGSRLGAPARRAIGLSLCLALFAGLAAACGSSTSSGQSARPTASLTTSASAAASAQEPAVSIDPASYEGDTGGFGTAGSALEDAGYKDRYEGTDGLDHMAEAYAIIERGLPKAVDLSQVKAEEPGGVSCEVYILWEPEGRRDTLLPPGGHGERIYEIQVDLGSYVKGGDAIAYVWFLSRADGDTLASQDPYGTPKAYPNQAFSFQLDKGTAAALLDLFWVKGTPAAS